MNIEPQWIFMVVWGVISLLTGLLTRLIWVKIEKSDKDNIARIGILEKSLTKRVTSIEKISDTNREHIAEIRNDQTGFSIKLEHVDISIKQMREDNKEQFEKLFEVIGGLERYLREGVK